MKQIKRAPDKGLAGARTQKDKLAYDTVKIREIFCLQQMVCDEGL